MKELKHYCGFCGKEVDIIYAWSYDNQAVHEECIKLNDIEFYNDIVKVRNKLYRDINLRYET